MKSIGNQKILDLVRQRDELLEQHPELVPLQEKWEETMKKAKTTPNKLMLGKKLLLEQLSNLGQANQNLIDSVLNIKKELDKFSK